MSEAVPVVHCAPELWIETLRDARNGGFAMFDFLTAVDETDRAEDPGFDIVVHLYDITPGDLRETLICTRVPDGQNMPSCTGLWRGAAWHERETHEMFGIGFDDFEDGTGLGLRPLLLPDGFEGTPLRKSFVLTARVSKPWPGAKDPADPPTGATTDVKDGKDARPARAPRRRMQPPGIPDPTWGPR
ncbi:NADH-quinone oxidoreductase subunit C [Dermatophilaceae bacterium Sec6.4]|nr:NADH-quinone oxidoreductase subunit C [Actinomycetota bacterium]